MKRQEKIGMILEWFSARSLLTGFGVSPMNSLETQFRFEVPHEKRGRVTCLHCGEIWYTTPCWVEKRNPDLLKMLTYHIEEQCKFAIQQRQQHMGARFVIAASGTVENKT
jgi:phage terminase large subunit GpA-like protein